MDNINEIGEGVKPYYFSIGEETRYGMNYNFKTEDGDEYLVEFMETFIQGIYDLAFYSVGKSGFMDDSETNKGRQFAIVSTVMEIIKDFLKEFPHTTGIEFSGKSKEGVDTNQRNLLYNAYVKKNIHKLPGWDFKVRDIDTILFKKETQTESVESRGLGKLIFESLMEDMNFQESIAIVPGGFKPPTLGHFYLVDEISKRDEIDKIIVIIGAKDRDGITAQNSYDVWQIYKELLNNKVTFEISKQSPVTDAYDYAKNNPENLYYFVVGRDEDGTRYKNAASKNNVKIIGIGDISPGVSGTNARKEIMNDDFIAFQRYMPAELTDKQRKQVWDIVSKKEQLNEGAYDSVVTKISSEIFRNWKENFDGEYEIVYEDEIETTNAKGHPLKFRLEAMITPTSKIEGISMGGSVDDEEDNPIIYISCDVNPDDMPDVWSEISMELKDTLRHEIEHLTQQGLNVIKGKEIESDYEKVYKKDGSAKPKYFKLDREVDAMLQGMYLKAKKTRTPLNKVINDYLSLFNLPKKKYKSILDKWEKRLPALNLPPIREENIPGGLSSGKSLEDFYNHHDPKNYYDIKDYKRKFSSKLKKGLKVELEHTTSDKIATEIALDHLWEDVNYYDKLEKIESINEVGEANVSSYKTHTVTPERHSGKLKQIRFTSDSEIKYIISLNLIQGFVDVDFEVDAYKEQYPETNKGELFKVMSTVVNEISKYIDMYVFDDIPVLGIRYNPKEKENDKVEIGSLNNQRDKLYRAFITKLKPGTTFTERGGTVFAIFPTKEDINESNQDLNIQDLYYKQYSGTLEKGIEKEIKFLKSLLPQISKHHGKEERTKFWDFIENLKGTIKRVPIDSVKPVQFGDDYENASSKEQAEQYEKILNGESTFEDARESNFYPLLINSNTNFIIDGHHRHYSLKKINSPYVVCLFVDIPEEYLDELYRNHEKMLEQRKQVNEMEENEYKYWALHSDIFNKIKNNPDEEFNKLKPTLNSQQLEALLYFYDLIKSEIKPIKENKGIKDIQSYLNEVTEYCCNELKIPTPKIELVGEEYTKQNKSFAGYSPSDNKVYLMIEGRKLIEVWRSLSHEIYHHYQNIKGELTHESGLDGSQHENEANAYGGKISRKFGKKYPNSFFMNC